jgi:transposase
MELTQQKYEKIEDSLPLQRGNVRLSNLEVLNAILYVAEQGCKWRGLPGRFGNWHTIYVRMNRWAKSGVLDRVFEKLQHGNGQNHSCRSRVAASVAKYVVPSRTRVRRPSCRKSASCTTGS